MARVLKGGVRDLISSLQAGEQTDQAITQVIMQTLVLKVHSEHTGRIGERKKGTKRVRGAESHLVDTAC